MIQHLRKIEFKYPARKDGASFFTPLALLVGRARATGGIIAFAKRV
jgi:hypothetical protein